MALGINIIRNNGGQVQLATPAQPSAQADYFKLYWSSISGGPYAFTKSFPNAVDPNATPGSALVYLYRTDIGLAPEDTFYVKVTSVKGVTESLLANSIESSVPREGAKSYDDLVDDVATGVEIHGYEINRDRWLRVKVGADGRLDVGVTSSALPAGAATSANQTTEIGHLSQIEAAAEAAETAVESIDAKVSTEDKQDAEIARLTAIEAVETSIDTKVSTAANQAIKIALLTAIDQSTDATETAVESLDTKLNVLGQKTMANSTPVVLPSDQSELKVTDVAQTGTSYALISVGLVATLIPSSPVSGRKRLVIQNRGETDLFIGIAPHYPIKLGVNGVFDLPIGPSVAIGGIRIAGTGGVAVMEFS